MVVLSFTLSSLWWKDGFCLLQSVWVKTATLQWWRSWKPFRWVDVQVALEQFTANDGTRDSIFFVYYTHNEEKKVGVSEQPGWIRTQFLNPNLTQKYRESPPYDPSWEPAELLGSAAIKRPNPWPLPTSQALLPLFWSESLSSLRGSLSRR